MNVRRGSGHNNREQTGITRSAGGVEGGVQKVGYRTSLYKTEINVDWTAERCADSQVGRRSVKMKQIDPENFL